MEHLKKLIVNDAGVEIAYTDSGAPSQTTYPTIIAVLGLCFTAPVFKKVQALAAAQGVRFVALNRRNYPGSTPFSPQELQILDQASEEQKDVWLEDRGHEIARFVVSFIIKESIPPVSGKQGGVILLGWSIGGATTNTAIAAADTLPSDIRSVFTHYVRASILHECPLITFGLPSPEKEWFPLSDPSIPPELRLPMFGQWVTGYFKHGDLTTRNVDNLSHVLSSTHRVPTIYNIPESDQKQMVFCDAGAAAEASIYAVFGAQLNRAYRKALFEEQTRDLFPYLKTSFLAGTEAPSSSITGLWGVQQDAEAADVKDIMFKVEPGSNHFIHWDDPVRALQLYLECAGL